jgi:hypothetical protein
METIKIFHAFTNNSLQRINSINFLQNMISRNYVEICDIPHFRKMGQNIAATTLRGKLSDILSVMSPCSTWIRDSCLRCDNPTLRGKLSEILSVMSPCSTWIHDSCLRCDNPTLRGKLSEILSVMSPLLHVDTGLVLKV